MSSRAKQGIFFSTGLIGLILAAGVSPVSAQKGGNCCCCCASSTNMVRMQMPTPQMFRPSLPMPPQMGMRFQPARPAFTMLRTPTPIRPLGPAVPNFNLLLLQQKLREMLLQQQQIALLLQLQQQNQLLLQQQQQAQLVLLQQQQQQRQHLLQQQAMNPPKLPQVQQTPHVMAPPNLLQTVSTSAPSSSSSSYSASLSTGSPATETPAEVKTLTQKDLEGLLKQMTRKTELELQHALRDDRAEIRWAAAWTIGNQLKPYPDQLIPLLVDPTEAVRNAAHRGLILIANRDIVRESQRKRQTLRLQEMTDYGPETAQASVSDLNDAAKLWRWHFANNPVK